LKELCRSEEKENIEKVTIGRRYWPDLCGLGTSWFSCKTWSDFIGIWLG